MFNEQKPNFNPRFGASEGAGYVQHGGNTVLGTGAVSCGSPAAATPSSALHNSLVELQQTTDSLEQALHHLHAKLAPVIYSEPPAVTGTGQDGCGSGAPLLNVVEIHREHLKRLLALTDSMINRLIV